MHQSNYRNPKLRLQNYIDEAIHTKIQSKCFLREQDVRYYFKHRHIGLAGISNDMVVDQCLAAIRRLRVWREIEKRNEFFEMINR